MSDTKTTFNQFTGYTDEIITTLNENFSKTQISKAQYDNIYNDLDDSPHLKFYRVFKIIGYAIIIGIYVFLIVMTFDKRADSPIGGIIFTTLFTLMLIFLKITSNKIKKNNRVFFECLIAGDYVTYQISVTNKEIKKLYYGRRAPRDNYIYAGDIGFSVAFLVYDSISVNDIVDVLIYNVEGKYYLSLYKKI